LATPLLLLPGEGVAQIPLLSALLVRRVADASGMAQNFLGCDRDQSLLLPPDLRDWLDEDHLTATVARPTTRR
jgi:hypothetical protein